MKVFMRLETNHNLSEIFIENNSSIIIGRNIKETNYHILDELMSGVHCRISLNFPKLEIQDMGSKNGTYLNGTRIEQSEVFIGDEIKIGKTKVCLKTDKMDDQSIRALTFPGGIRNQSLYGLELDFTGTRLINQSLLTSQKNSELSINKGLESRIKANSMNKLSKEEIKIKHRELASTAKTIDMLLMVFSFAIPLIIINSIALINKSLILDNRLIVLGIMEVLFVLLTYFINFRLLKFSLGEHLSGVEKKYRNQ